MPAFRTPMTGLVLAAGLALVPALLAGPAPGEAPGIDLAGLDRSVQPGADFFAYANGTWLATAEIPADRPGYGAGALVAERTQKWTAEIIAEAAKAPAGSEARKVADYHASFLDEATIEARGLRPLAPLLARIDRISELEGLSRMLGGTLRSDVDALNNTHFHTDNLMGVWVAADLQQPTRYLPYLLQGGLTMPDRAYYLDASPRMAEVRDKFRVHLVKVFQLAHFKGAGTRASRVYELERRIAELHATRAASEDVRGTAVWTRSELDKVAPGLHWTAYLAAAGLEGQERFGIWHPAAIAGLSALVKSEPLEAWKDWLAFHAIERRSFVLPRAFVEERFAFHGQTLAGIGQLRERSKRAVEATSLALGEPVGRLYVERHFPPAAKARIEAMVQNLMKAFGRRIDALDWMTPETRTKAKEKLATLKVGVGYPDRWRDYSGLDIRPGDAYGNAERASEFEYRWNLAKLGQPVDRGEWVMTPQTVNAVNLPVLNAMNFPAAILQPPFFDPERPEAMDYGAIGSTIGHEVSHSFDDQGAQFGADGRLHDWWTEADRAHFEAAAARLVQQYDAYRPFPDLAVNGKQTLSENIADVAGLAAAYDAYRLSLGGRPAPVVAGFSGDQQFFLAYAQSWREKDREPALRQRVLGDGHAPSRYRVLTVRNLDAWYDAFDVKPGQALYLAPADRVRIW
jgi:predicted metalloendopeptidase